MLQPLKMEMRKETSKWLTTPSKYAGLRAAIAAKLMIGFWFGIGVILAIGVVDSLNYCAGALTSSDLWQGSRMLILEMSIFPLSEMLTYVSIKFGLSTGIEK